MGHHAWMMLEGAMAEQNHNAVKRQCSTCVAFMKEDGVDGGRCLPSLKPVKMDDTCDQWAENGDWYCPQCDTYLDGSRVTFEETCDTCGTDVEWRTEEER